MPLLNKSVCLLICEVEHEEKNVKTPSEIEPSGEPLPPYLLDRSNPGQAKALSSSIKDKRKDRAAKFSVPLPKVKGISGM